MDYLEWTKTEQSELGAASYLLSDSRFEKLKPKERFKIIQYQDMWFKLLQGFSNLFKNSKLLIELHPSMAGQIRGTLSEELLILENKYKSELFYSKTKSTKYKDLYRFLFSIHNDEDLDDLIYRYSESYQLVIYFITNSFNFNDFIRYVDEGDIANRSQQFIDFCRTGCESIVEFGPIATEMKITTLKKYEGQMFLFLLDYKKEIL